MIIAKRIISTSTAFGWCKKYTGNVIFSQSANHTVIKLKEYDKKFIFFKEEVRIDVGEKVNFYSRDYEDGKIAHINAYEILIDDVSVKYRWIDTGYAMVEYEKNELRGLKLKAIETKT